ncbi:MAG: phenylalanine--tRNA ligase subunit beta [Flavobacteriaceae bacterium]|nr:phenylalanine--tRNA ligase subunit beta [Flavobacteriaceae bacterium]
MKISYNWLQDFIQTQLNVNEISDILTDIGLEVEGIQSLGISEEDLQHFVVGKVLTCVPHPNADKLRITTVDVGAGEIHQIVCGAPNVAQGQKVPVAKIGAVIKDANGNEFTIKKAKLRGEESHGMICSKSELRLSDDHSGIWEMDPELLPGTPLAQVIETGEDYIIEIGLTPNRADAMSHYGVARDLYTALRFRNIEAKFISSDYPEIHEKKEENPIKVEIQDAENCPRYAGIYISNIQVKPSPQWLQTRLKSLGISPKNNIVDITNYILHGWGQPLHAFDANKIIGNKIIVKSGEFSNEIFQTLDKTERKLQGNELLICDIENPIAIGGVMGGWESSVTDQTTDVFIESAYFNPVSVRKTAKYHGINSDSSFRFERGIDPDFTIKALKLAVDLIQKTAGGEVAGNLIDVYPTPISPHYTKFNFKKVEKVIGMHIPKEKIKEIFQLLDIQIISENDEILELEIPSYRVDVQREADLIEEILRIYGFNEIDNPSKMTMALVPGDGFIDYDVENRLAETLVSFGFIEAMNLSMYKSEYNERLQFDSEKSVEIINSLSKDMAQMRRSLLPGLLENIDFNIKRKRENLKLFEIGNTYQRDQNGFNETPTLGIILCGNKHEENFAVKPEKVSFAFLKGIIEHLFNKFKMNNVELILSQNSIQTQEIQYKINELIVATILQVPNPLLKQFDISQDVFYAEIKLSDFIKIFKSAPTTQFKELSKFPMVRRDLALLLDKSQTYQEVEKMILSTDSQLIKKVNLFDVFEGDSLPKGKKSYAISIQLQDETKTMNDEQIDRIMEKIIQKLEKELKAELRK